MAYPRQPMGINCHLQRRRLIPMSDRTGVTTAARAADGDGVTGDLADLPEESSRRRSR